MEVISLIRNGNGRFYGFVDKEEEYTEFKFENYIADFLHSYLKKDYKNYEHFVGVMSKFNPEVFFLINPIKITEISNSELNRVHGIMVQL